ncbi:MAG: hypothetical protein V2G42_04335 [bacterium JZ-2024 1]
MISILSLSMSPAFVLAPVVKEGGGISADGVGIWLAALLTLFVFSFLYRDNFLYKVAESLFVGVSIGYLVGTTYHNDIVDNVYVPLVARLDSARLAELHGLSEISYLLAHFGKLDLWPLVPLVMGLLTLAPFVIPRHSWLTSIPFAFYIGRGAGAAIPATIQASILAQLHGTTYAFAAVASGISDGSFRIVDFLWALLLLLGILSTLWYFYFSAEHRGKFPRGFARLGIWFVMVGFGAAFGLTVMARVSLLIGRIEFLFSDWLGMLPK